MLWFFRPQLAAGYVRGMSTPCHKKILEQAGVEECLSPLQNKQATSLHELKQLSLAVHMDCMDQHIDLSKQRLILKDFERIAITFNPIDGRQVKRTYWAENVLCDYENLFQSNLCRP